MAQTADEIRRELDQKRDELTRDVDRIEAKVKSTFDVARQFEENPLLGVGLAVLGGLLVGRLTGGGDRDRWQSHAGSRWSVTRGDASRAAAPSLMSDLAAGLQEHVRRGAGGSLDTVIDTAVAAVTSLLADQAKELVGQSLSGDPSGAGRPAGSWAAGREREHPAMNHPAPRATAEARPYPDPRSSAKVVEAESDAASPRAAMRDSA